jgi:hypothetical protein
MKPLSSRILLGLLPVLLAACAPAPAVPNPAPASSSSSAGMTSSASSLGISVTQPSPMQIVSSPLAVTGEARGSWYFEASFPVKLLDSNGNVIAQAPAQAQGDWMTANFVPFQATLTFVTASQTGTLVLEKDNPSGEPQNAGSISIPVQF